MLERISLVLILLMLGAGWADRPIAYASANDGAVVQELIDRAAHKGVTRPPGETLAFLDSIDAELADATSSQLAQLSLIRARSHALKTDYENAFGILEELLESDLKPAQHLRALELAANLALHVDQYETGFEYMNRALALQEAVDDPALKSGVFGLAAYWHSQLGDQEKGLEYADRTLELARATGDIRELCVAMEKLGQAEEMMGLYEQALQRYEAGLEICEQAQDPVFFGVLHTLTGRLMSRLGRYEEAEPWLQVGIELTEEAGFKDGATDAMVNYAELLMDQGRYEEAHAVIQEILSRTSSGGRPQNRADAHHMLAQIKRREGNYQSAWENISEYLQAREMVLNLERARKIAFQEVQFDLHSREQEIQLLREQARVSELQETTRKQQRLIQIIAYAMAGLVLLLMLALLLRTLRERRHFRHLSAHDGLTGMLNHSHFIDAAKNRVRDALESRQNLVLLLADVDHFKKFNDQHGHQAGDEVLRKAASRFREILSQYGEVGRIGGEEFAACLPEMDRNRAARLVDEVRIALQTCRLTDVEDTITMSFGIAQLRPFDDFDNLRARADSTLYTAKHQGRDRLVVDDTPASIGSR
jgi:diguanylate cyclase (GGDEF)-like protein